jgi:hypothetical protein
VAKYKKKDKSPALGARPTGEKSPRTVVDATSYYDRKASWRVSKVQLVNPYGWHELSLNEVEHVRSKLAQFETMTWGEIFDKARDRNHPIPVSKLRCREAQKWMERNMKDFDTLWTLRFTGPERVWGIFSEGAYQVIFWDPEHLIYPTGR